MTRRAVLRDQRGFFAVGVELPETPINVGTLWRTADLFGAAYIFTVGERYKRQASDTMKTWRHTPLIHYDTLEDLEAGLPYACPLVGIELDERATMLDCYHHRERACYLLGSEDRGLTRQALALCDDVVQLPGEHSMNVAVAGSIVLYDRITRAGLGVSPSENRG